jgi:hypothetical protein
MGNHDESGGVDMDWARAHCTCRNCPTYIECGEAGAFCVGLVPSNCIHNEQGCICPGCPVHVQYHKDAMFYCTHGQPPIPPGGDPT